MAETLKVLTSIATTNSTVNWDAPIQQTTILDSTNISFPRNITLNQNGVKISRPGYSVGINTTVLLAAAVAVETNLTWAPLITVQPVAVSIAYGSGASFAVTATSEIAMTYQWQVSTNSGSSYSNLTNAGVYTNVTTATMAISSVNGLHGNYYRCNVTNAKGTTATDGVMLTVVPAISAQPPDRTIAAPGATTFTVTASGTATLLYQWYLSTDAGVNYTALTNAGVYTTVTTATLNISNVTGLNARKYRVVVTDGNVQSTTSSAGTLTVT